MAAQIHPDLELPSATSDIDYYAAEGIRARSRRENAQCASGRWSAPRSPAWSPSSR